MNDFNITKKKTTGINRNKITTVADGFETKKAAGEFLIDQIDMYPDFIDTSNGVIYDISSESTTFEVGDDSVQIGDYLYRINEIK